MAQGQLKKSARTRHFIIEKAAPVFNTKGIAGTSMLDITNATGLTKGSIYGNFEGKEELATASFKHNSRHVLDRIKLITLSDRSAASKLRAITDFYRQYIYRPELSGGCPILNTAIEADDTHSVLRDLVLEALDYLRRSIIYILQEGIENGEFDQNIQTEQIASVFLGLIEGGIMQTKLYNKAKYLVDCLLHIDQIVLGLTPNQ